MYKKPETKPITLGGKLVKVALSRGTLNISLPYSVGTLIGATRMSIEPPGELRSGVLAFCDTFWRSGLLAFWPYGLLRTGVQIKPDLGNVRTSSLVGCTAGVVWYSDGALLAHPVSTSVCFRLCAPGGSRVLATKVSKPTLPTCR